MLTCVVERIEPVAASHTILSCCTHMIGTACYALRLIFAPSCACATWYTHVVLWHKIDRALLAHPSRRHPWAIATHACGCIVSDNLITGAHLAPHTVIQAAILKNRTGLAHRDMLNELADETSRITSPPQPMLLLSQNCTLGIIAILTRCLTQRESRPLSLRTWPASKRG